MVHECKIEERLEIEKGAENCDIVNVSQVVMVVAAATVLVGKKKSKSNKGV